MWESNEPAEATPVAEETKPTYEELEQKYANAVLLQQQTETDRNWYRNQHSELKRQKDKVDQWITTEIQDDALSSRQVEELCDILNLSNEVKQTYEVMVKATIEVVAPRTYNFDNFDEMDLSLDQVSISSGNGDLEVDVEDYEITEVNQS